MSLYGRIRRNILTAREDIFQTLLRARAHNFCVGMLARSDEDGLLLFHHGGGVGGGKINGAWMSGFTVPGDKRHMHFAHHKMETLLICIITACKECSRKLFISNKIVL